MKTAHKKVLVITTSLILALATHAIWLPLPARLLSPADRVVKADAIVVLSGDWTAGREEKAAELYRQGFAPKIVRALEAENRAFEFAKRVLGQKGTQKDAYSAFFESKGVRPSDIIVGDEVVTSTFDELKAVKAITEGNHFTSIILVTGDYHMRRALMTAKWIFKGTGTKIYNASWHSQEFCPGKWWLSEYNVKEVVLEYLSLLLYATYHAALGR